MFQLSLLLGNPRRNSQAQHSAALRRCASQTQVNRCGPGSQRKVDCSHGQHYCSSWGRASAIAVLVLASSARATSERGPVRHFLRGFLFFIFAVFSICSLVLRHCRAQITRTTTTKAIATISSSCLQVDMSSILIDTIKVFRSLGSFMPPNITKSSCLLDPLHLSSEEQSITAYCLSLHAACSDPVIWFFLLFFVMLLLLSPVL